MLHLAALLSGYAEENFDLGMKVNLHGTLNVMERVRELGAKLGAPQIYLYVSTDYVACFNEYNRTHPVTEESFRLSPVSYGVQKVRSTPWRRVRRPTHRAGRRRATSCSSATTTARAFSTGACAA